MMQLHLDEIASQLPENIHAAMLVDGAGWHISDALEIPTNITLIKIPPRSPELNPAEKPWQYMKNNFLSHLVLNSYDDILDACHHAWNKITAEPGRITSLTNFPYLYCHVT
jgi:transposase